MEVNDPDADHRRRLPLAEPDGAGAAQGAAHHRQTSRARASGGLLLGRRYAAGGQALAAGLFAGVLRAGIPIWTDTSLVRIDDDGARVTGAVVSHGGNDFTITARRGVVLAAGGFDHHMDMRWKFQSESLGANQSLGAETNTGDAIRLAQDLGAAIDLMDQSWWFPAVAPLPGKAPAVMLAERSLPGSPDRRPERQPVRQRVVRLHVVRSASAGSGAVGQSGRDRCGSSSTRSTATAMYSPPNCFPAWPIPQAWYDAGIAHRADVSTELAEQDGRTGEAVRRHDAALQRGWPTRASTPTSTEATAPTTATTAIPRSPRTPTCARCSTARSTR